MDTPRPSRGRPRSDARTGEMLWAAAQLFASRGVGSTSTRDIAAAAHTTERTLFKHFGSKEALVRAVLDEAVLAHLSPLSLAGLRRAVDAFDSDLPAWHRALLTSRLAALAAAPELTRLLLVELLRDAAVRERFAQQWTTALWQPLVALFSQLQADRRMRNDVTAQRLARQFLSLNLGFLLPRLLLAPGLAWDDEAEIAALAACFDSATRPPA